MEELVEVNDYLPIAVSSHSIEKENTVRNKSDKV